MKITKAILREMVKRELNEAPSADETNEAIAGAVVEEIVRYLHSEVAFSNVGEMVMGTVTTGVFIPEGPYYDAAESIAEDVCQVLKDDIKNFVLEMIHSLAEINKLK